MPGASAVSAVWPRKPDRDRGRSRAGGALPNRVRAISRCGSLRPPCWYRSPIAIAYAGGWPWAVLVTLAAIGLYVEWLMIVGLRGDMRVVATGRCRARHCRALSRVGRLDAALVVLGVGLVAVALISPERRNWSAAGFFYAAVAEVASVLVRLDPVKGFVALIFVLLIVWVTDIGGYFAGRGIGGPKLWPRVSPKKTWAGAIGGFVASLAVARAFAAFDLGKIGPLLLISGASFGGFSARRSLRIRGQSGALASRIPARSFPAMAGCWIAWMDLSQPSPWRRFLGSCGAAPMASAAVLWFGEEMSAVPLRNNKAAASAVRTVTVLGATGSIGDSTMDLLRGARDRYQVEALTANSQCRGARQARPRIQRALCGGRRSQQARRIEGSAGRHADRMRRRRKRDHRGGGAAGRLGDGGRQRRGRIEARARRGRSRRGGRARQQGMPGLRRRLLHAARGEGRRLHSAGGFRA